MGCTSCSAFSIYGILHQNKGIKNRRITIANDTPILIQLSIKVDIHRYSGISPLIFSQVLAIGLAIGFRFFESQGNFKGEGTPLNL